MINNLTNKALGYNNRYMSSLRTLLSGRTHNQDANLHIAAERCGQC